MPRISRFRFEQQVAVLIGLLCLALVATLVGGTIWMGRRQSVQLINARMAELADNMASSLDVSMSERFRDIRIISELRPLQGAWRSDRDEVRRVLDSLKRSLPDYAWIGFATPDGLVRAATGAMLEGQSVAERPWFKDGLLAPSVNDVHEATLLSSYLPQASGPEPFRFVDVSIPVYDDSHTLIGVLGAHMSWTWAAELRQRLLGGHGSERETDVWILSSAGKMLLGPTFDAMPYDPARLKAITDQRHGVFEDTTGPQDAMLTGFTVASGFRDYPGLGWIVVARQPASVAFEPVANMVRTTLLLGLAVAALSILLAWLIARRAAAPIRHLTRAARLIGRDPSITTLPRLGGSREFIELSASLRALLGRAGAAERQLQVAEKQSALSATKLMAEIQSLQHVADTDALTGLLNRRAFMAHAEDAMTSFRLYRRSITMFVLDIDLFKRVNDKYGHAAGDDVIRKVAETLKNAVRPTDKVARLGGEEFVILLHEITADDALALADRVRASVASASVRHGDARIAVTISIGAAVACLSADRDVQALIERADHALYYAKHRGRDCVVFDGLQDSSDVSQVA